MKLPIIGLDKKPLTVSFDAKGNNYQAANDVIVNNYPYLQQKLPNYLSLVIGRLEKVLDNNPPSLNSLELYEINEKIIHNKVIVYKEVIENYGNYGAIVDSIYETLDDGKPNAKSRFLRSINVKYIKLVGELISQNEGKEKQELICIFADSIIEKIIDILRVDFMGSANGDSIMGEDLDICLVIIVCKAFIDCKILENPVQA